MTDNTSEHVSTAIRTAQIIVVALAMGVTTFMGIVVFMKLQQESPPLAMPKEAGLWLVGLAVMMGCGAASVIVPRIVQNANVRRLPAEAFDMRDAESPLMALFQQTTILGAALLEGAAFFNLVMYFVEGLTPSLFATLLLLAGILAHVPSVGRFNAWREKLKGRQRDAASLSELRSR